MPSIVSYQKIITEYTTYKLNEPRDLQGSSLATELCEIDGVTYVSVPDGVALPPQPAEITVVPVVLTDALREQIKAASPHVRLINQRVVERIREKYSQDDEIKMLSLSQSPEKDGYLAHVVACREWGAQEKAAISLSPANITQRLDDLDVLYQQKLYSNVDALFPSGTKTIQLRNDKDFSIFRDIVYDAVAMRAAGQESALVEFRTEDNMTQILPASEFIPVGLDVLAAKKALWSVRTAHKDAILLLTEEQAATYVITTGWPTTNEPYWVQRERADRNYRDYVRRVAARLNNGTPEGNVAEILKLKAIGE